MELKNEIPKYIVIKQDILEKIASGVYVCGDAIPNQQELSQKYNVSRVTVREAVNELKARGILISIKGRARSSRIRSTVIMGRTDWVV